MGGVGGGRGGQAVLWCEFVGVWLQPPGRQRWRTKRWQMCHLGAALAGPSGPRRLAASSQPPGGGRTIQVVLWHRVAPPRLHHRLQRPALRGSVSSERAHVRGRSGPATLCSQLTSAAQRSAAAVHPALHGLLAASDCPRPRAHLQRVAARSQHVPQLWVQQIGVGRVVVRVQRSKRQQHALRGGSAARGPSSRPRRRR